MEHRFSLGIDLGTSNSAIALSEVDGEQTDIIELTQTIGYSPPQCQRGACKSGVQMQPVAWSTVEKFFQQAIWLPLFFILAPIPGPRPYGHRNGHNACPSLAM